MQTQGFERVKRLAVQSLRAQEIGARCRAVSGGGHVKRTPARIRLDAVCTARQHAEEFRQFTFRSRADQRSSTQKFRHARGIERWLGSQILKERPEITFEMQPVDYFLHLCTDAFNFGQAQFMNFVRRQIRSREVTDQKLIVGQTTVQACDADRLTTCRHIFSEEKFQQRPISGHYIAFDEIHAARCEIRPLFVTYRRREY